LGAAFPDARVRAGRAANRPVRVHDAVQKVSAGRQDRRRCRQLLNARDRNVRLALRAASDASAGRDADRYGAGRRGLCRERVHDFRPSASADALESRLARQQALRPQDVLLMAHLGLAWLPEQRPRAFATREFLRDARLALQYESESAEPE
jgi:hypothetical protein